MRVNVTKVLTALGFLFLPCPSDEGNRVNFRDVVVSIKKTGTMDERPKE
jgi:hypothetical protein